jgi:hypothetical protein
VTLEASYEDFLLMTRARRGGLRDFLLPELFATEKSLTPYGYPPEIFQAEAIGVLAEPICFLPVMILVIIAGWRYRAKQRPKFLGIPMLAVLPLVFNGLVLMYRSVINTLGIWMALSLSFFTSMFILIAGALLLFILALIILAVQHG